MIFRLTVTSLSLVMFLISCWVLVDPPWMSLPVNIKDTAFAVRTQSTPLCL